MAAIHFEHVTKAFGSTIAVNDLDLEVKDGEFLVLVGPSGCGKSTALRMLAGLEEITSGSIYIGERRVNNVAAKDRDIAMVFQSYALYPHMTVYDNIAFALKLRKQNKQEIEQHVREAARMLGIEALLRRKPGQLSGGQRQRVALGRAIVREPAAFLLDEPLSNLDAKLRVQTRAEISKLHERLRATFVYVTHDQVEAMTMADRIAVLNEGVLQQLGTPQQLYEAPANLFVATFIGSPAMNLIPGRIIAMNETVHFESGAIRLPLLTTSAKRLAERIGTEVILGVRPEYIHDPGYQPAKISGERLTTRVDLSEAMGSETYLHLRTADGEHQLIARVDPRTTARPGHDFEALIDVERLHFFDPATNSAIV
jgi:multiple sugar transport system ATP-binding protein